jgi:Domain of unknown function (DUF1772)
MLRVLSLVAVLAASLFAGAALYINVAEQPARLTLDTRSAAAQWAPSYMRATWMQAPLALVSLLCGIAVWLMTGRVGWLVAAVLIGLVVAFTLLGIMPTNRSLLLHGRDLGSPDTRALLERWGRLHAVRTALSLVATIQYLWLLSGG